ncbi:hypothetical protein IAT38_005312 [Cryptococcus sp. DSM 104549]
MPNPIFTLPPARRPSTSPSPATEEAWSMRADIEAGLKGTQEATVPGTREEDKKWAFKRSVPTLVLYDEMGLRLYDKITSEAPEYYLFNDELNLLKEHGGEIARAMGFPRKPAANGDDSGASHDGPEIELELESDGEHQPAKSWKPARWGDTEVGKWNGGVNGEEGLGGGWQTGWDVVELGAGALRKTAHLLTALSSSLPTPPANASSHPAPITYHPLDLSLPELDRVLGEMHEAVGDKLDGKVACLGLHGDYEAGLQFIREGKLAALRPSGEAIEANDAHTVGIGTGPSPQAIPTNQRPAHPEDSPILSPLSAYLATPRDQPSPLPMDVDVTELTCGPGANRRSSDGSESPESSDGFKVYGLAQQPQRQNKAPGGGGAPAPKKEEAARRPLHFVFLGSSLGNFDRPGAAPFLRSLPLRAGDTLLLGLDGRPAPGPEGAKKVEVAYNDPSGHTRRFEEHGWEVVKNELGLGEGNDVEFVGRYNEELGRHEAYYKSKTKQSIRLPTSGEEITLEAGELLNIEWSYKYSIKEAMDLFAASDLRVVNSWKAPDSEYRLWLVERPSVRFIAPPSDDIPKESEDKMAMAGAMIQKGEMEKVKGVPKWEEWVGLWKLWDHITLDMIPYELLHKKPIDLRHICLFYLGHIPTFLDIHLTRMTKGNHTEPEFFKTIFERGIDPDVDDPTKCHDHSEVPMSEADWPSLAEILSFRDRVRSRLHKIYTDLSNGSRPLNRHTGRVLFMTFEHEAMHAETLLYMLAQSPLTRPPTAVKTPDWEALGKMWAAKAETVRSRILDIEGGEVVMGHDDREADDAQFGSAEGWETHEFGWDNEHPRVVQTVKPFMVDSLPVSNAKYLFYLTCTGALANLTDATAPASWVKVNDQWMVRTLYGPVSMQVAARWPLMASKLELEAFAKWKGGRLPTEGELRLLWESKEGPRVMATVNNVGCENWHPIPPTETTVDNAGHVIHGHNGGVWEWTDTPFDGYDGFITSELYPGYSTDFFDGKHFVVLGGSFCTIPQIAGRKSFRNWYQSNYKYSFIGGRVAYDV